MKLLITYRSDEEGSWWQCELPNAGLWIGEGDTPKDAYNSYIGLVTELDEPNKGHEDYDWCQERGLIK